LFVFLCCCGGNNQNQLQIAESESEIKKEALAIFYPGQARNSFATMSCYFSGYPA
jgi:hypothetical protein